MSAANESAARAPDSRGERFVIRKCGFGGPAKMPCPVHGFSESLVSRRQRRILTEIRMEAAIHLTVAITEAKRDCAGPALDGALAGIAEAFGLPEAEVFKLAGVELDDRVCRDPECVGYGRTAAWHSSQRCPYCNGELQDGQKHDHIDDSYECLERPRGDY